MIDKNVEEMKQLLFEDAARLVLEYGSPSVMLLQRRLHIGYTEARTLIDRMVAEKIIHSPEAIDARLPSHQQQDTLPTIEEMRGFLDKPQRQVGLRGVDTFTPPVRGIPALPIEHEVLATILVDSRFHAWVTATYPDLCHKAELYPGAERDQLTRIKAAWSASLDNGSSSDSGRGATEGQEDEEDDPSECERCFRLMTIPFGMEPTKYCNPCAQELLAETQQKILEAAKVITAAQRAIAYRTDIGGLTRKACEEWLRQIATPPESKPGGCSE